MATIVNTPSAPASESSGMGYLFGAVLLVIVAIVLAYMLVPALRGGSAAAPSNPIEQAPAGGDSSTNIQVPDKIDVNLNQGENPAQ